MKTLSSKLLKAVVIILSIAFLSISFFLYKMNYSLIEAGAIANLKSSLDSISRSAGYFLSDISAYRKDVIMDDIIGKSLDSPLSENVGSKLVLNARMQQYLLQKRLVKPYIVDIFVEGENGLSVVSVQPTNPVVIKEKLIDPAWKEQERSSDWFLIQSSKSFFSNYSGKPVISNRQLVYSYQKEYRKIGTAYFIINTDVLDNIIKGMPVDFCDYYIVDNKTNQILSASDGSAGSNFSGNSGIQEKLFNVTIVSSNNSNWSVIGRVYYSKIRLSALKDLRPILFVCIILLICAGVAVELYVYYQTISIKKLEKAMAKAAEGNLDVIADIHSKDEIQRLSEIFNSMLSKIKYLISDVKAEQQAKRNFQLKALLMQINPHFIYNTLNCVIYLAYDKRNEDIVRLSRCFISLLHDTILWEDGFTTIDKEVTYLKNYIDIQKIRYGGIFTVEFEVDPNIMQRTMPKMLLQPLVENCIFHGILNKEERNEPGQIVIEAKPQPDDSILITVSDNGAGSELDNFNRSLSASHDKMSGIGLSNIRERLKTLYGTDITIHSEIGVGTRIQFKIFDKNEEGL